MEQLRKGIYTLGIFTKNYVKTTDTKLKESTINKFLKGVYDEVLDKMILENYTFDLAGLFDVRFVRVERNFSKMAVNFGESNKRKAEILARGGKLATRIDTSPEGMPIFDDGELWMVFHTDPYYVIMEMHVRVLHNEDGRYKPGSLTAWIKKQNTKALKRFMNYEKQGLVNRLNIPLDNASKNNII
jgi:hypothetical protein